MNNFVGVFRDSRLRKTVLGVLFALGAVLDVLLLTSRVSSTSASLIKSATLWTTGDDYTPAVAFLIATIGVACIAAYLFGLLVTLTTRTTVSPWFFCSALAGHLASAVLGAISDTLSVSGMLFAVVGTVIAAIGSAVSLVCHRADNPMSEPAGARKRILLTSGILSTLVTFALFFTPLCTKTEADGTTSSIAPLSAVGSGDIVSLLVFIVLFVGAVVSFLSLLGSFKAYSWPDGEYGKKVKSVIVLNTAISAVYFLAGVLVCSMSNSKGENYTTLAFVPFLVSAAIALLHAFAIRGAVEYEPFEQERDARTARIEFLIYGLLVSAATVVSILSDIIHIDYSANGLGSVTLNGYDIFMTYNSLDSGFQLVAFFLIAILTAVVCMTVASVVSFACRSRLFFKITLFEILIGAISSLLIGMFGKYYEVVQKLNEDIIRNLIEDLIGFDIGSVELVYKVTGQSFFYFLVVMAIVLVALLRKPYSRGTTAEMLVATLPATELGDEEEAPAPTPAPIVIDVQGGDAPTDAPKRDSDPCPAFTELDGKDSDFKWQLAERQASLFANPTLPSIVQFVVDYARESRLHLFYEPETIATFIAGLGATHLTILQGMSGTGKTSLPKIFAEAIMGNCDIIEVESSWRDKNELLGYYNEFSRTYTPKKFTQALYKACLNEEALTFIVLDEMNLSRIEYYFSDFLSLMEHEAEHRKIKLLGVPLARTENGVKISYAKLEDGHTITVPQNVWFIGTANRDESTFEISDKVYDRAHTMNFNKRAPRTEIDKNKPEMPKRFIPAKEFSKLLEDAKSFHPIIIEQHETVRKVEELLQPYNISFGYRVADQMSNFVSIYCACFPGSPTAEHTALEQILLSKVVSKLEYKSVENKELLAAKFAALGLNKCSEFILKLGED